MIPLVVLVTPCVFSAALASYSITSGEAWEKTRCVYPRISLAFKKIAKHAEVLEQGKRPIPLETINAVQVRRAGRGKHGFSYPMDDHNMNIHCMLASSKPESLGIREIPTRAYLFLFGQVLNKAVPSACPSIWQKDVLGHIQCLKGLW